MVHRLLIALTIILGLTFTTAQFNQTHAQYRYTSYGYLEMLKQMILARASLFPTTSPSVTPTPTVFSASPTTKPTATPTPKPTTIVTKTPTPTPTKAPTGTMQPTPTKAVTSTPTASPTSDVTSYIMGEINKYRASQGLGAVTTSTQTCNFAATRAVEISTSFNHDGFQNRLNNKTLPYTSWTKVTENIAMTSDFKQVVNMWINSPGHAANMRADTPFVCVKQHGNYYAYEGMKP